ncbi:MAG TPA: LemA family protein [Abditibacterium sp.]|jgi:LemA protein
MTSDSQSHPDLAVQRLQKDGRFSDEEARDIYARASEIQSQAFLDEDKLNAEHLERGANRAGISDAALQQAIKEREIERQNALEAAKTRAKQKAALTKRLLISGGVFAALLGGTLWSAQNTLGAARAGVESANAQVENAFQRRYNLIPNLISVTKSTLDNQSALIQSLDIAQKAARGASSVTQKRDAEAKLANAIGQTLSALRTKEASPVVDKVIDEMVGAENRIFIEQRKLNRAIENYNFAANRFPVSIGRGILGYPARYESFKASEKARETPKF